MTVFYILLLIGIFLLVSLLYIFYWETDIWLGVLSGILASLIVATNITIAVDLTGYKPYHDKIMTKPLEPVEGDSIFLLKYDAGFKLFGIDGDEYAIPDKRCTVLLIPDTAKPYCEVFNPSMKKWTRLFYRGNSKKAPGRTYKLYIQKNMILEKRAEEIPGITSY